MKTLILTLLLAAAPQFAQAKQVPNEEAQISVARAVAVHALNAPGAETAVNIVVKDGGGSTDLSPTQEIYLTLYKKGEMFDVDATYLIDSIYFLGSVEAREDGRYEVKAKANIGERSFTDVTYVIDARAAVKAVEKATCTDENCWTKAPKVKAKISVVKK